MAAAAPRNLRVVRAQAAACVLPLYSIATPALAWHRQVHSIRIYSHLASLAVHVRCSCCACDRGQQWLAAGTVRQSVSECVDVHASCTSALWPQPVWIWRDAHSYFLNTL